MPLVPRIRSAPLRAMSSPTSASNRSILVNVPGDDASVELADHERGRALVWYGQEYLSREGDDRDVELFFEVYGKSPSPVLGGQPRFLPGLHSCSDISASYRAEILRLAAEQARERLRR